MTTATPEQRILETEASIWKYFPEHGGENTYDEEGYIWNGFCASLQEHIVEGIVQGTRYEKISYRKLCKQSGVDGKWFVEHVELLGLENTKHGAKSWAHYLQTREPLRQW